MRHPLSAVVPAAFAALLLSSCLAGPHQMRRSIDDWDHQMYANSPLLDGLLWIPVPLFPLLTGLALAGDAVTFDFYSFWFRDVWRGSGTGFEHLRVEAPAGKAFSLIGTDGAWFRVMK